MANAVRPVSWLIIPREHEVSGPNTYSDFLARELEVRLRAASVEMVKFSSPGSKLRVFQISRVPQVGTQNTPNVQDTPDTKQYIYYTL